VNYLRLVTLQEREFKAQQPRALDDGDDVGRLCKPEPEDGSKPTQNLSPMVHDIATYRKSRQHAQGSAHYKLFTVALLIWYLGKMNLYRVNSASMFD